MNDLYRAVLREVATVGTAFSNGGFDLYLVGGIVRDIHLGVPLNDLDFDLTTNARPSEIKALVAPMATAVWAQGERFGTIGAQIGGRPFEITTHRREAYSEDSRKPEVVFGDDIEVDLSRRDFTLNAMAIRLSDGSLIDPFNGLGALDNNVLATPIDAEVSFSDDPLRILRASRFIARYGLDVDPSILTAARDLIDRMRVVSVERIRTELDKLLMARSPSAGFDFLTSVGAWPYVLTPIDAPTLELLSAQLDEAPLDLVLRRAVMFGHVAPDEPAPVLASMRYSNAEIRELQRLLNGVNTIRSWASPSPQFAKASMVRPLVHSVGYANVDRLQQLLTVHGVDDRGFAEVFNELDASEDLTVLSPVLTGQEVMAALDIEPGPLVGEAMALLQQRRLDHGPLDPTGELDYLLTNFRSS